ncbi:DUF779 domain-containing protein [Tomitella fengzijianii]|uniref:DUF779 domain-containing protein n=1 Tax=Tomitella fengzijianii TaxID=2597660 RepID=A0A516X1I7_9ACTN|nr:DUF779 domain-containing protein [Tomitella fengzijianii]QDQ96945.1 DUF779 domain-containing protein [Tomitella fengzijianii]
MIAPPRVAATVAARDLLCSLRRRHGPLMLHQSGGCCDGSSPMCYGAGEFLVGDRDVLLGELDLAAEPGVVPAARPIGENAVAVWISGPQFAAWQHTQLILDVVAGRGGGFSLEAPEGVRFLTRSRPFTQAELRALTDAPPLTGAQVEAGDVPPAPGLPVVVEDAADAGSACGFR